MVGIPFFVEGRYLAVATTAVQRYCLSQSCVRLEPDGLRSLTSSMLLQFAQKSPPQPHPSFLWRHPHTFELRRRVWMELQYPTRDWPPAHAGDDQRPGRRSEFPYVRRDAQRRIEASIEAGVELGEVVFDAPPSISRGWVLHGEAHHGRAQQTLHVTHEYRPLPARSSF
jgi:hypothetical protein